eukprot:537263_1
MMQTYTSYKTRSSFKAPRVCTKVTFLQSATSSYKTEVPTKHHHDLLQSRSSYKAPSPARTKVKFLQTTTSSHKTEVPSKHVPLRGRIQTEVPTKQRHEFMRRSSFKARSQVHIRRSSFKAAPRVHIKEEVPSKHR